MRDIKGAEREAAKEGERSQEIEHEVESHKNRLEHLESALDTLRDSAGDMASEDLQDSIGSAESAIQKTQEKLDELRKQRDDMLTENKELSDRTNAAHSKRSQALVKLGMAQGLTTGADSSMSQSIQEMNQSLQKDMNRLGRLDADLQSARSRLEALDI
jgi:chromosome segregation ATPase